MASPIHISTIMSRFSVSRITAERIEKHLYAPPGGWSNASEFECNISYDLAYANYHKRFEQHTRPARNCED